MYPIRASLAVVTHCSTSASLGVKNWGPAMPGDHSLPDNVLNDQQMNMPQRSDLSCRARWFMSGGGVRGLDGRSDRGTSQAGNEHGDHGATTGIDRPLHGASSIIGIRGTENVPAIG